MVVIWSVITDQFFRSVIWSVIWLFLVVMQGATKKRLGEPLNIHHSNGISKYFGCPVIQGKVERSTINEVILKSQKKLASWKARFLSRACKIILIKANLVSSPLHVLNCFKVTKRNNKDLISAQKVLF